MRMAVCFGQQMVLDAVVSNRLAVNRVNVVGESIDGETILIHLGTGTYYSLDAVGGEMWAFLEREATPEELVVHTAQSYDADRAVIEASVLAFLDTLVAEDLVREAGDGSQPDTSDGMNAPGEPVVSASAFSPPTLAKYTDLQDFLLADPLHDVDEQAGWPHARAD
jgi:hypothetical protein